MGLIVALFFALVLMFVLANFTSRVIEKMLGKLLKAFWAYLKYTGAMRWIAEAWLRIWTAVSARFKHRGRSTEKGKQPMRGDEYRAQNSGDANFEVTSRIGARGYV